MPTSVAVLPSAGPLYKKVKRRMLGALAAGEWRPGTPIPAEARLAQEYAVSIGTLRKAVDELVGENILIRQQGRGTFVATHDRERLLFHFFHIVPESGEREYPDVRLLDFRRARADAFAADHLGIAPGDPVLRIRNRLSLGGRPLIVDTLTLPAALFPGLDRKRFAGRPSTVYNLYQDAFGISVVRTRERLKATLADADTAALLGLRPGAPLLQIRRIALAYNDHPVELRISLVDTQTHEYWAEIGRGD